MNSTASAMNSTESPQSTEGKWIKKWMSEPKCCVPYVLLREIKMLIFNIVHFFFCIFYFPRAVILNNCNYCSAFLVCNMKDSNRKTSWSFKITRAMEIFMEIIFISVFRPLNARMLKCKITIRNFYLFWRFVTLETRGKLSQVSFRKDFWEFY